MKTSTIRGHRCIHLALILLAKTELFRQFQYLTVPLNISRQETHGRRWRGPAG